MIAFSVILHRKLSNDETELLNEIPKQSFFDSFKFQNIVYSKI